MDTEATGATNGTNKETHSPTYTVQDLQHIFGLTTEKGFDTPFSIFTWEDWQKMVVSMIQALPRYQLAISQKEAREAMLISIEVMQMALEMLKEACVWSEEPRQSGPNVRSKLR